MKEPEWVKTFLPKLRLGLKDKANRLNVADGVRLPYACETVAYDADGSGQNACVLYETDILITDMMEDGCWVPRLVVECKLRSISTHGALAYSMKAATHKNVHPYLRYGVLIGDRDNKGIPGRLVRHGAEFDFMVTWHGMSPMEGEWTGFLRLVKKEIEASRAMQEFLTTSRTPSRIKYSTLHRPLILEMADPSRKRRIKVIKEVGYGEMSIRELESGSIEIEAEGRLILPVKPRLRKIANDLGISLESENGNSRNTRQLGKAVIRTLMERGSLD